MFGMGQHNHQPPERVKRGRPRKLTPAETETATAETSSASENQDVDTGLSGNEPREKKPRGRQAGQKAALERIELMLDMTLGAAAGVAGKANVVDGLIIQSGAPALKASILQLCEQDKRVREYLYQMTASSTYFNVAIASAAIIIPVLANHNLIPPLFSPQPQQEASVNQADFFQA